MTSARPSLAVVVPMANEEQTVEVFVAGVLAHLETDDRLFCIFDRASRDATQGKVQALATDEPRLTVVFDEASTSPVDAYLRGYREALASGQDWILEMDAGMAHLPEEIPAFLAAMSRGAEFAAGSRFIGGASYTGGSRLHKWLLSRGGTWLGNLLLRTRYSDLTSGFKCHTRAVLAALLEHGIHSRAHSFQIEVRWLLAGCRWEEVPIRYGGASHHIGPAILYDCLKNLARIWLASLRQSHPIAIPQSVSR